MKKVSTALAFAIGLSGSAFLAAQTQSGTPGTTAGSARTAQTGGGQLGTITVTGCLQRTNTNDAASPNTPPATTTTQATRTGGSFILANAVSTGAGMGKTSASTGGTTGATSGASASASTTPSGSTTGTSGTAAAAGGRGMMRATGAGRSYTLIERNTGELAPHIGHQIEITGTIASAAMGSSGDGANASATGSPNSASARAAGQTPGGLMMPDGMMANQRLQVSSMRMIAATCPAATSSTTR